MSFSSRSISHSSLFSEAGIQRARSVAGGAGSIKMSSASVSMASAGATYFNGGLDVSSLSNNRKDTMNNLNDRLAVYLEKVHSLERANSDLEAKIRDFYEKQSAIQAYDPSGFYETINKLRIQILDATTDNARLVLQIDNAKLAADDFKMKFESELAFRLGVEHDISGLRKALDELTVNRSDLELEIESLREELIFLKKNHQEELDVLKGRIGGKVNVELDSAPPVDLSKVIAEVRHQYEEMMEKNRQEMESWYRTQSQSLSTEVAVCQQSFESSRTEVTDLRRSAQSLEIELQSLLNMKQSLEGTLVETEGRYGAELATIQNLISQIELNLQQVRSDYENQSLEYRRLLDIKTKLEQEIATYRRLLDGEDVSIQAASQLETQKSVKIVSKEEAQSSSTTTIKTVKTYVEEVVDGKVVSSSSLQEVSEIKK
ncbi:keratin, type I cytoskeletal 47 kDa-like isoform X1 [Hyla sarda]|uniref:keratin, type I cytoskeletal 47 kDa-like isoform X1 n=1 Tax=Hyla sarda TaxID=327740 RepID=UPI0024C32F07|nr:keratin, type I cytoskeletal 47 kDa-like isoform X1 [Hyla sarda]